MHADKLNYESRENAPQKLLTINPTLSLVYWVMYVLTKIFTSKSYYHTNYLTATASEAAAMQFNMKIVREAKRQVVSIPI